jgi:ribosomal-protein-alanine N-acetyltransferase
MKTGEVELRLASPRDAPRLAAMSRDLVELGLGWSWIPSRIARHVRALESVVLVAQDGASVVAFAIMRFEIEDAHLDLLAVKPAYRRAGIGRKLIAWLEESALVAGISVIYLEVRAGNEVAQTFYEKLGYRRIKRVSGYYGGRESAICMARDLWCPTVTNTT